MRYFVMGPDGTKYGPADIVALQQWVAEGRVNPTTMLVDEISGAQVPASSVPGLFGVSHASGTIPQSYGENNAYSRPMGNNLDTTPTLIKAILALVCCCQPLGIVAVVFAAMAISSAQTQPAQAAENLKKSDMWANWAIGVGLVGGLLYFGFFVLAGLAGR